MLWSQARATTIDCHRFAPAILYLGNVFYLFCLSQIALARCRSDEGPAYTLNNTRYMLPAVNVLGVSVRCLEDRLDSISECRIRAPAINRQAKSNPGQRMPVEAVVHLKV